MAYGTKSGEKLTFDINYGFITAATATLEVNETMYQDTLSCYKITSKAQTTPFFDSLYKVRDTIESFCDQTNMNTYYFSKQLNEGKYRQKRIQICRPDNTATYSSYQFKKKTYKTTNFSISANSLDILSAFYWVRTQKLQVGTSVYINVCADGNNYVAEVKIHKKETIPSIYGKKDCYVIEPILKGESLFKQSGRILIWITADEFKVPLKLESKIIFGSFSAVLKDGKNVPYPKK